MYVNGETKTPPLRIVHCFREPTGGLFRHVCDLARTQAAEGHHVGIICDSNTGGDHEDSILQALQSDLSLGIFRFPMHRQIGLRDFHAAFKAWRIIRKLQPDILHGHGAKGGVFSRLSDSALRVFKSRVARIYSPHGGSLHFDPKTLRGRAVFMIERLLASLTDAFIFVSKQEKHIYEEKIGRPSGLHNVIYNGLAAEEFTPIVLQSDATDLLFIGTMRDLKGPDLLIRAIANISDRFGLTLTATLVGDGDDKQKFASLVQELNLTEQIRFLPAMPARKAFQLGRIMVIPSRAEAFPYIVLEALAAQKPVIASNVGGIPEIFGVGSNALVEPDVEALIVKIANTLDDEASFQAGQPSPTHLQERFNLQAMAKSIEIIYREALS